MKSPIRSLSVMATILLLPLAAHADIAGGFGPRYPRGGPGSPGYEQAMAAYEMKVMMFNGLTIALFAGGIAGLVMCARQMYKAAKAKADPWLAKSLRNMGAAYGFSGFALLLLPFFMNTAEEMAIADAFGGICFYLFFRRRSQSALAKKAELEKQPSPLA